MGISGVGDYPPQDHYHIRHMVVHKVDPEGAPTHGPPWEVQHWERYLSCRLKEGNPLCLWFRRGGVHLSYTHPASC